MKKTIFGCTLLIVATLYAIPAAYALAIPIYLIGFTFVALGSMQNDEKK